MDNIYLTEYSELYCKTGKQDRLMSFFQARVGMTRKYAWAIPTDEAIATCIKYAPLIEIGAGRGYWASLIRKSGADILAFDKDIEANNWKEVGTWTEVSQGDENTIKSCPNRTLFLCWPCYDTPMAYNCLKNYKDDTLIYVGEGWGGCCANDKFWKEIEKKWVEVESVDIPQWDGMHDYLVVYKRKLKWGTK